MDVVRLYSDYSIPSADVGESHYRDGWVNTACPFCTGNPGNHLGYNLSENYYYCWRCGYKSTRQALSKLVGVGFREAARIERQYKGRSTKPTAKIKVKKKAFKFPSMTKPLTEVNYAVRYMKGRGFSSADLSKLVRRFSLMATTMGSMFDKMDLSFRIIAPITENNKPVSWQSRDMTGDSSFKYITCPGNREITPHKEVLYNIKEFSGTIVLCEGIFDVWKVFLSGFEATCCFGVEYTWHQLELLMKFEKVIIFMDPDKAGREHSGTLVRQLLFSGVECYVIVNPFDKDPGDLTKPQIKKVITPYIK